MNKNFSYNSDIRDDEIRVIQTAGGTGGSKRKTLVRVLVIVLILLIGAIALVLSGRNEAPAMRTDSGKNCSALPSMVQPGKTLVITSTSEEQLEKVIDVLDRSGIDGIEYHLEK